MPTSTTSESELLSTIQAVPAEVRAYLAACEDDAEAAAALALYLLGVRPTALAALAAAYAAWLGQAAREAPENDPIHVAARDLDDELTTEELSGSSVDFAASPELTEAVTSSGIGGPEGAGEGGEAAGGAEPPTDAVASCDCDRDDTGASPGTYTCVTCGGRVVVEPDAEAAPE